MPVQRLAGKSILRVLQERDEGMAIEMLSGSGGESGKFKEGRVEVHGGDRMMTDGTGLGDPGSGDHVGFPDPPFVEPALPAPEGQV